MDGNPEIDEKTVSMHSFTESKVKLTKEQSNLFTEMNDGTNEKINVDSGRGFKIPTPDELLLRLRLRRKKNLEKDRKMLRSLLLLVIVFFLCWSESILILSLTKYLYFLSNLGFHIH
jgi:hypothetical protein